MLRLTPSKIMHIVKVVVAIVAFIIWLTLFILCALGEYYVGYDGLDGPRGRKFPWGASALFIGVLLVAVIISHFFL